MLFSSFLLYSGFAQADEFKAGNANVGLFSEGALGADSTNIDAGIFFNFEGININIPDDSLPNMGIFSTRAVVDTGVDISLGDEVTSTFQFGIRGDLLTGIQFFSFVPVSFAMKDFEFRYRGTGGFNKALYGVGGFVPIIFDKDSSEDQPIYFGLNIGARVRSDFTENPTAIQPELRLLTEDFSAQLGALVTIGNQNSQETSIKGHFAINHLIKEGTQLGIECNAYRVSDTVTSMDMEAVEVMLYFGANPI